MNDTEMRNLQALLNRAVYHTDRGIGDNLDTIRRRLGERCLVEEGRCLVEKEKEKEKEEKEKVEKEEIVSLNQILVAVLVRRQTLLYKDRQEVKPRLKRIIKRSDWFDWDQVTTLPQPATAMILGFIGLEKKLTTDTSHSLVNYPISDNCNAEAIVQRNIVMEKAVLVMHYAFKETMDRYKSETIEKYRQMSMAKIKALFRAHSCLRSYKNCGYLNVTSKLLFITTLSSLFDKTIVCKYMMMTLIIASSL